MKAPPLPRDEARRQRDLDSTGILDTPAEEGFDDVVKVAAQLCGTPIALVSLVDRDRQWFKARVGLAATETPRRVSFCAHAISDSAPLIVADTQQDDRFADNPLVTGDPHMRFYAGVPLQLDEDATAVGTLCVIDQVPRELTPSQLAGLRALGRQVATELRLRKSLKETRAARPTDLIPVGPGDFVGGKWRLVDRIGQGGLGVVYSAVDDRGQPVAIKFLFPKWAAEPDVLDRFVREARTMRRLHHANVARIIDVGNLDVEVGTVPFIVMERLEGADLRVILHERGTFTWRAAAGHVAEACDGLSVVHEAGVVHRDLKPSNLFLARVGPPEAVTEVIKIVDFGIAKDEQNSGSLTRTAALLGSIRYMSPEQMLSAASVSPKSDLWSLGAILYELTVGKPVFGQANDMSTCAAVLSGTIPRLRSVLPEVSTAFDEMVAACLSRDPSVRPASAAELAASLRAALTA